MENPKMPFNSKNYKLMIIGVVIILTGFVIMSVDGEEYGYGFRGRMDERYDMVRSVVGEKFIYIRNYMPHKPYGQHVSYMFQTPTTQVWKRMFDEGKLNKAQSHFWKTKPAEELYDLENDRDEVKNLVKSKEHADILKRMRKAHLDHINKIIDCIYKTESLFKKFIIKIIIYLFC